MRCLKSALILIIAAFAVESRANLINYEYSGTITTASSTGIPDFGINVGDTFRFNVTIDSDARVIISPLYYMPALFTLTIGDKQFGSPAGNMRVWRSTPSGDPTFGNPEQPGRINYEAYLSVPWASGSSSLISYLTIDNNHVSFDSWAGYPTIRYNIGGTVTSVVRTPESSNTGLLLSLALVPLLALSPVKRRTRQI